MLDRAHSITPLLALALLVSAGTLSACTKTEGTSSGSTSSTASSTPPASASASAATAAPDASPVAADTTTGTTPTGGADATAPVASGAASAGKTATANSAGTPVASASATAPECGTKPLPDCPLQSWMKQNTNPAIASNDLPALATALDKTATFAPPGYANWATIAKDGAKAAKAGDMTAAKASCRTCHDQYKTKYKAEMRARKI